MPSWMKRVYSDTGLMLVDDPRRAIETLCKFGDSDVDRASFKTRYEKMVGKRVSMQTSDIRFYTLVLFGLLDYVRGRKTMYHLTLVAKELCKLLHSPGGLSEYRKLLSKVLLYTEPKSKLFENFIHFISSKGQLTEDTVKKEFQDEVARTLIAWSEEAGLIGLYKDRIWAIPLPKRDYTIDEFWEATRQAYSQLQRTEMVGLRRLYLPIGEIRAYLSPKLGLTKEDFYVRFVGLKGSKFGERIRLYGGPSDAYESEESLPYKGRRYLYVSMKP